MDFDELLKSYSVIVADELAVRPLLAADTFEKKGEPADPNLHGHVYVGCFAMWLASKNALGTSKYDSEQLRRKVESQPLPADFSFTEINGKLFLANVSTSFQNFVSAYVRDSSGYSDDYIEINVVPNLLKDITEVKNCFQTFAVTKPVIDQRFEAYTKADADWMQSKNYYAPTLLTDNEKEVNGWLLAFTRACMMDSLPEGSRRIELN